MNETLKKQPLIAVVGPTASGKTALAVELALYFGGEVVSADSMQVYKRMDIATAKPDEAEKKGVPHHLIDLIEPDGAAFSVAQYARRAHAVIADIAARGRVPILAGGTGLYIDAVIDNIDFSNIRSDEAVRAELRALADAHGNDYMLGLLREADPELAASLHPNNLGRILRALEVYRVTGVPMSEHQRRSRQMPARYDVCMIGLNFTDRAMLYDRVNRRVDLMMERGLLDEARAVSAVCRGTALQAIGYKELIPYLDAGAPLEECINRLKQSTRRYAKRQLSWFRRDARNVWLMVDKSESLRELTEKAGCVVHKSGIL